MTVHTYVDDVVIMGTPAEVEGLVRRRGYQIDVEGMAPIRWDQVEGPLDRDRTPTLSEDEEYFNRWYDGMEGGDPYDPHLEMTPTRRAVVEEIRSPRAYGVPCLHHVCATSIVEGSSAKVEAV